MTRKSSSALPGDRRVRRTQATLQRALIGLVGERDLSQISVADVADRADVSRSTFYDHYQDVHELAEAACTSMLDDMFGYVLALDTARAHPASFQEDPDPALPAGPSRLRYRPACSAKCAKKPVSAGSGSSWKSAG